MHKPTAIMSLAQKTIEDLSKDKEDHDRLRLSQ